MELLRLLLDHPYAVAGAAVSAYIASIVIYRLYLSPIAHFPGPRLAALTVMYEFYWEAIRHGQFTFHIGELHKKYGIVASFPSPSFPTLFAVFAVFGWRESMC
jgi:hypothetical protein